MSSTNLDHSFNTFKKKIRSVHPGYERSLNDFRIVRLFTRHKYANVFIATDIKSGSKVFLKELIPDMVSDRKLVMLYREVHTFASLNSEFINKLIGYTISPKLSIILEYHENDTLTNFLKHKSDKITSTQLTKIVFAISTAMAHLHKKGFIHRDLKPSNIIMDANEMPKLNDLWNSRSISKKHPMTRMIGTLNVMAPEVMTEHTYTSRCDVYSFGVLLYFICEGRLAFQELKEEDLVCAVSVGHQFAPFIETPENLQELILKCWNHDPSQRPSFLQICNAFAKNTYAFPGANKEDIYQTALSFIEIQRQKKRDMNQIECKSDDDLNSSHDENKGDKMNNNNNGKKINMKKEETNPILKLSEKFNVENLNAALFTLKPDDFDIFYEVVSMHLQTMSNTNQINNLNNENNVNNVNNDNNVSNKDNKNNNINNGISNNFYNLSCNSSTMIQQILNAVSDLVDKDHKFLESMCYCGFFELPILRDPIFIESSFLLARNLMMFCPNLVMPYMRPLFKCLIEAKSSDMILLFFHLANSYSKMKKPLLIFDILLNSHDLYVNKDCGVHFIRLVYFLLQNSQHFRESRIIDIRSIVTNFLKSQKESVLHETYALICQIYDKEFLVPFDTVLCHLLQSEALKNDVISLLLRVESFPIQRRVGNTLVAAAKTSSRAALILFRFADQQNETAYYLATKMTSWMKTGLANSLDTYKLVFILLSKHVVRSSMGLSPDFPYLLSFIVNQRSEFALTSLSMIIKAVLQAPNIAIFGAIENSKFLEHYFTLASKTDSKRVIQSSVVILDTVARIAFSESYLIYFPKLVGIIANQNELSYGAIQVLVIVSQYQQCRDELRRLGIINYFKSMLNYPDYKEIAERFLRNVNEPIELSGKE